MEIILNGKRCIITPLSSILNKYESERIKESIVLHRDYIIGLNLDNVKDCTFDFIELLNLTKNISIFNIESNLFALFNKMNLDKHINLYNLEEDFYNNKNRLLNRNFHVISKN